MSENTESNKKHPWTVLVAMNPSLLSCTSLKSVKSLFLSFLFTNPSFPNLPFFIYISLQKANLLKENPPSFLPFCVLLLLESLLSAWCRISFFHMYVATLIPFSLQKYFACLLWVHVPLWELISNPNSLIRQ